MAEAALIEAMVRSDIDQGLLLEAERLQLHAHVGVQALALDRRHRLLVLAADGDRLLLPEGREVC